MNITIPPTEVVIGIIAGLIGIGVLAVAIFMWSRKGRKP